MALAYVGFLALWQLLTPSESSLGTSERNPLLLFFAVGLVVVIVGGFHAVAAAVPYKPWGWPVGLIAICLGFSTCTAPVSLLLLVWWLKPETKAAFGRL
jgi:hypothetical protein